jgi:hypothetical protein
MGLLDGGHARALRAAQNLWDRGRRAEAIATLDDEVPGLMPRLFSTDALIVATLATYLMQTGDPRRGLKLLEAVPLGERPRTDIQAICLAARCCCRAAAGNLTGAHDDRAAIVRAMPQHPSLVQADDAIREARRSLLARTTISRPFESSR